MEGYDGIALIIGVGVYNSPFIGNLETAIPDACSIGDYFESCNYFVCYLKNPSKNDIDCTLKYVIMERIVKNAYRNVIIYYAGHGIFSRVAHYLILSNFLSSERILLEDDLMLHAYEVETFIKSVSEIRPDAAAIEERAVVVILDTYRGLSRSECRGESEIIVEEQKAFELNYDANIGFLISYACEPQVRFLDNTWSGGCGRYTEEILKELKKPGVAIIDALGTANQMVWHHSRGIQKPQMETNFPHMFYFPVTKVVAAPLAIVPVPNPEDNNEDPSHQDLETGKILSEENCFR